MSHCPEEIGQFAQGTCPGHENGGFRKFFAHTIHFSSIAETDNFPAIVLAG